MPSSIIQEPLNLVEWHTKSKGTWKMPLCKEMSSEVLIPSDECTDYMFCPPCMTIPKTLLVRDQCDADVKHRLTRFAWHYQKHLKRVSQTYSSVTSTEFMPRIAAHRIHWAVIHSACWAAFITESCIVSDGIGSVVWKSFAGRRMHCVMNTWLE